MTRNSNNSDFDFVRQQLEGVHESATDLVGRSESIRNAADSADDSDNVESVKSENCESIPDQSSLEPLVAWLSKSEENRAKYESVREFDRSLASALANVEEFELGLEERIKCIVKSGSFDEQVDNAGEVDDYQSLFDASDADPTNNDLAASNESGLELAKSKSSASQKKSIDGKHKVLRWWMASVGTLAAAAAIVLVAFLVQPDPQTPEEKFTAEILCNESLNWNPNRVSGNWNSDVAQAPANRMFPKHLVRLKAQSWKKMEIEGDQQGVVYNLIPDRNLSEAKAYLYVFRSDEDFQLPGQFSSHATANRKYRFWSVACRQDLVFVLVYEGDEKRLHDLIKIQQVG